jgi:hypothetical protein
MQSIPGTTANLYPGVQSRFDDYQGLHINQTDFIHFVVGSNAHIMYSLLIEIYRDFSNRESWLHYIAGL